MLGLAAIAAVALSVPASSRAAGAQRPMHLGMALSASVTGSVTRINSITVHGLPRHWSVRVRCLGHGCFTHTWRYRWKRDLRQLAARPFYAGQKLVITFRSPAYAPVAFIVLMQSYSLPQVTVYLRPHPALTKRVTTLGILAGITVN